MPLKCCYCYYNLILILISALYIYIYMCMCVKVAQSRPTLFDPLDYTVHGILQARILEWVAFPFSRDIYTHTHTYIYIYIYTHTHTHIYITLLKGNKRIYIINFHWVGQNFVQVFLRDIMEEPQRTFWSTQYGFILLYPWGNKPLERASFTSVLPSLQHCIKIRHAEQSHCKSCLWRESLAMAIQCIKTHQI